MPYKSEGIKIASTKHDRRRKLTSSDKVIIVSSHAGGVSKRQLSREYKVSRRLIDFIICPEKHKRNLELRKERGGSKMYYVKKTHTVAVREHRRYKQKLYLAGEISKEGC